MIIGPSQIIACPKCQGRVLPVSLREFQRPVRYGVSPAYWVKPRPRADADGDGQPGKNGWSG